MKKVIISNHSEVTAKGKLNNRKCKPVICIDTGVVYTSVTDAAMAHGTTSAAISGSYTGKSKTAKGKRFCLVSNMAEHYEEIAECMRKMYPDYIAAEAKRREEALEEERQRQEAKRLEKERKEKEKALAELKKYEAEIAAMKAKMKALEEKRDNVYYKCCDMSTFANI